VVAGSRWPQAAAVWCSAVGLRLVAMASGQHCCVLPLPKLLPSLLLPQRPNTAQHGAQHTPLLASPSVHPPVAADATVLLLRYRLLSSLARLRLRPLLERLLLPLPLLLPAARRPCAGLCCGVVTGVPLAAAAAGPLAAPALLLESGWSACRPTKPMLPCTCEGGGRASQWASIQVSSWLLVHPEDVRSCCAARAEVQERHAFARNHDLSQPS